MRIIILQPQDCHSVRLFRNLIKFEDNILRENVLQVSKMY